MRGLVGSHLAPPVCNNRQSRLWSIEISLIPYTTKHLGRRTLYQLYLTVLTCPPQRLRFKRYLSAHASLLMYDRQMALKEFQLLHQYWILWLGPTCTLISTCPPQRQRFKRYLSAQASLWMCDRQMALKEFQLLHQYSILWLCPTCTLVDAGLRHRILVGRLGQGANPRHHCLSHLQRVHLHSLMNKFLFFFI